MRARVPFLLLALATAAPPASVLATTLTGTVKIGGVAVDEEGDRSAVQETYDLHRGFAVSQIDLGGTLESGQVFTVDLRDINLDSRQGDFRFRAPGVLQFDAGYDQHRQVFDPLRGVTAERKDFHAGARVTPSRWLAFDGRLGYLSRDGERLAFPAGSPSALGTRYDNALLTGQLGAEVRSGRRGAALSCRVSDFSDELDPAADRTGRVLSARFYAPAPFYGRWTNLVRGAYGTRELSNGDVDHTLMSAQYTAVIEPIAPLELRYAFEGSRFDDDATDLKTDRFTHDVDVAYAFPDVRVRAGYGYETNDDDRSLTSYQSWRAGASFRAGTRVSGRVDYAGRIKQDQEDLTLLGDLDASRIRTELEFRPLGALAIGGGFARRERDLGDIDVHSEGDARHAFARWRRDGWGGVEADYRFSTDEYRDRVGTFETSSHIVTGRVDVDRIPRLGIGGGVTYLDIGRDLDIEKSIVFAEGRYRFTPHYFVEAKYQVYNYDDYILLDRYYTANVVRFNLGYDLAP